MGKLELLGRPMLRFFTGNRGNGEEEEWRFVVPPRVLQFFVFSAFFAAELKKG